ncbi:hypothetical protein [Wolbachia endosymbiont of Pentidionis agamae]|uniref:hypothetical protein n=1 Tax=Wolbachia endosymbiont of Pentidionis agamae TaxID=3110435 RepID=UPI002FD6F3B8
MTTDKEQQNFMDQYMASCQEQIKKLAEDPGLLQKTLEPFMKMSERLMEEGGLLNNSVSGGNISNAKVPLIDEKLLLKLDRLSRKLRVMTKEFIINNPNTNGFTEFDGVTKKLRSVIRKMHEQVDSEK